MNSVTSVGISVSIPPKYYYLFFYFDNNIYLTVKNYKKIVLPENKDVKLNRFISLKIMKKNNTNRKIV